MTKEATSIDRRSGGAWAVVFAALLVVYVALYAGRGFSDYDHGFVPALSWRVLRGECIYLDFLYVRPPLSPYLHAIPMALLPDSWGILGGRWTFFAMTWASAALAGLTLRRSLPFERRGVSMWLVAALGFLFSCNNLGPFPWHTVDGVFFGALGLFCLSRRPSWMWLVAGGVALFLSTLSKQSFYPMPVVGVAMVWLVHGAIWGRRALVVCFAVWGVPLGLAACFARDWLEAGLAQTASASGILDLLDAGAWEYLEGFKILGPFLLVSVASRRWGPPWLARWFPGAALWPLIVLQLSYHVIDAFQNQVWVKPKYHYAQLPFLLALFAAGLEWKRDRGLSVVLFALLGLSWCSSISWGAQNPLGCFTPVIAGVILLVHGRWRFRPPQVYYAGVLAACAGCFFLLQQFPYKDGLRRDAVHDLGEVFPRLSGVHAGSWTHGLHAELADLHARHGDRFAVLPAMPIANYVTGTDCPLPIDWALNAEVNGERWEEWLLDDLDRTEVVFLQRNHDHSLSRPGHRFDSWLTRHVRDEWDVVEEARFFVVYRRGHTVPVEASPGSWRQGSAQE